MPVENVEWLCENIYNVEFDKNYKSEESYVYGDYVYRYTPIAGYGDWYSTTIDNYKVLSDGKYEITASFYCVNANQLEHRHKIIAEWKEFDGKYDWTFYSIEKI